MFNNKLIINWLQSGVTTNYNKLLLLPCAYTNQKYKVVATRFWNTPTNNDIVVVNVGKQTLTQVGIYTDNTGTTHMSYVISIGY